MRLDYGATTMQATSLHGGDQSTLMISILVLAQELMPK